MIELREWSRLLEELQQEPVRLCNRVRHQLWRYYPHLLDLTDDVGADWFLELWALAPTADKAGRLRETTIARLLKQHRIRRLNAETACPILRQPAIKAAAGVTEAAASICAPCLLGCASSIVNVIKLSASLMSSARS